MIGPNRLYLLAIAVVLPISGGMIAACNGGEEVAYDSAGLTGDSGGADGTTDAGRVVLESGVLPTRSLEGGGPIPPSTPIPCPGGIDLDGGECDPGAGLGCCVKALGVTECQTQGYYFQGADNFCKFQGNFFLACQASNDDNICCWQKGLGSGVHTRFRPDCDGGLEACDPNADGGSCVSGGSCVPTSCKGVGMGYCQRGGGTDPCAP